MVNRSDASREVRASREPAQGFFDLGMYHEAWAALDELPLPNAAHPLTVSLRLDILLALHRLDDAVALGTGSCRAWPQTEGFFLKTASALMGLNDHLKAKAASFKLEKGKLVAG